MVACAASWNPLQASIDGSASPVAIPVDLPHVLNSHDNTLGNLRAEFSRKDFFHELYSQRTLLLPD